MFNTNIIKTEINETWTTFEYAGKIWFKIVKSHKVVNAAENQSFIKDFMGVVVKDHIISPPIYGFKQNGFMESCSKDEFDNAAMCVG